MNPAAYQTIKPCREIQPFVRRLLVVDGDRLEEKVLRPVPTGYNYLLWLRNGDASVSFGRGPPRRLGNLSLLGQIESQDIAITYHDGVSGVLAEFTATGFYRLTHTPGLALLGQVQDLRTINPEMHHRLVCCLNTRLVERKGSATALELALLNCMGDSLPATEYLEYVAERIEVLDGLVRISDLSREIGISQRQLCRKYKEVVGVGPKFFSKVVQANTAFCSLIAGEVASLTKLAQACGYYDQAHFTHTIQEIFKHSPRTLVTGSPSALVDFLRDSRRLHRTSQ